jgi:hypothetical protein
VGYKFDVGHYSDCCCVNPQLIFRFSFRCQLRMEVNEGFTCSFLQEAVAIDVKEGCYVPLGDVNKSIVVSPDLSSIVGE